MKKIPTLAILAFTLIACSRTGEQKTFNLKGTWILESIEEPDGYKYEYTNSDRTQLRIYDDSCYYQCQLMKAPTGTMIVPSSSGTYTLIERGKDQYLYMNDDGSHPFSTENDSTFMVQETGHKYYWKECHDYDDKKTNTIISIVKNDIENPNNFSNRYVFSYAEEKQERKIHTFIYLFIFIALGAVAFLYYHYNMYKNKKRIEQELKRLEQERKTMPEPVREAKNLVEEEFHNSTFYLNIRRKITCGEHLTDEDWKDINEKFNSIYPRFTSTLLNLHNMSQIELQVCQLIKLNSSPSEIANVLCKEKSSISTTRSRLYSKVFGGKGSSKEWDDFILSL